MFHPAACSGIAAPVHLVFRVLGLLITFLEASKPWPLKTEHPKAKAVPE